MERINELTTFLLIIIPLGGIARITHCILAIAFAQVSEEDAGVYKKRIKNTIVFIILAEAAAGLLTMILGYIGG